MCVVSIHFDDYFIEPLKGTTMSLIKLIAASVMIAVLSLCLLLEMNSKEKTSLMVADETNLAHMKQIAKQLQTRLFQHGFTFVVDDCFAEDFKSQTGLHLNDFDFNREDFKQVFDNAFSQDWVMMVKLENIEYVQNAIVLYWDCAVDAYGIPLPEKNHPSFTGVSFYKVKHGKIVSSYAINIVSNFYHTLPV